MKIYYIPYIQVGNSLKIRKVGYAVQYMNEWKLRCNIMNVEYGSIKLGPHKDYSNWISDLFGVSCQFGCYFPYFGPILWSSVSRMCNSIEKGFLCIWCASGLKCVVDHCVIRCNLVWLWYSCCNMNYIRLIEIDWLCTKCDWNHSLFLRQEW